MISFRLKCKQICFCHVSSYSLVSVTRFCLVYVCQQRSCRMEGLSRRSRTSLIPDYWLWIKDPSARKTAGSIWKHTIVSAENHQSEQHNKKRPTQNTSAQKHSNGFNILSCMYVRKSVPLIFNPNNQEVSNKIFSMKWKIKPILGLLQFCFAFIIIFITIKHIFTLISHCCNGNTLHSHKK